MNCRNLVLTSNIFETSKFRLPLDFALSSGKWQLYVKSLSVEGLKDTLSSSIFALTCNLITDYRQVSHRRELYQPILQTFTFKDVEYQVINFDQFWFEINNPSEFIEIALKDSFNEKRQISLSHSCNVQIQVLLQRKC